MMSKVLILQNSSRSGSPGYVNGAQQYIRPHNATGVGRSSRMGNIERWSCHRLRWSSQKPTQNSGRGRSPDLEGTWDGQNPENSISTTHVSGVFTAWTGSIIWPILWHTGRDLSMRNAMSCTKWNDFWFIRKFSKIIFKSQNIYIHIIYTSTTWTSYRYLIMLCYLSSGRRT